MVSRQTQAIKITEDLPRQPTIADDTLPFLEVNLAVYLVKDYLSSPGNREHTVMVNVPKKKNGIG